MQTFIQVREPSPARRAGKRWWALVAMSVAVLAIGIDLTVLNVALPTLAKSLRASTSQLQWFVDSYSLVLAGLLLPAGLLRRPLRPQAASARRVGRVRSELGRLRLRGLSRCPHRHPGTARRGRVGDHDGLALHAGRPLPDRSGTAKGDGCDHGLHDARLPARTSARGLASQPLLVGVGLHHQRPGRGRSPRRDRRPDARVPGCQCLQDRWLSASSCRVSAWWESPTG